MVHGCRLCTDVGCLTADAQSCSIRDGPLLIIQPEHTLGELRAFHKHNSVAYNRTYILVQTKTMLYTVTMTSMLPMRMVVKHTLPVCRKCKVSNLQPAASLHTMSQYVQFEDLSSLDRRLVAAAKVCSAGRCEKNGALLCYHHLLVRATQAGCLRASLPAANAQRPHRARGHCM